MDTRAINDDPFCTSTLPGHSILPSFDVVEHALHGIYWYHSLFVLTLPYQDSKATSR